MSLLFYGYSVFKNVRNHYFIGSTVKLELHADLTVSLLFYVSLVLSQSTVGREMKTWNVFQRHQ